MQQLPRFTIQLGSVLVFLVSAAGAPKAVAQVIVPGINAPLIVPQPPPPIQPPPIPQIGVPLQPNLAPLPQNSFSDRVSNCVQAGTASGLTTGSLDAYTRQCANQQ